MQRLIDANKLRECEQTWSCDYEPDGYSHVVEIKDIDNAKTILELFDNPTNGDMQLVLCPELEVRDFGSFIEAHSPNVEIRVSKSWWNSPYKFQKSEEIC